MRFFFLLFMLDTDPIRYDTGVITVLPVADPGFPRGGGANSPGGSQHTILTNFLHEIERIWTPGGVRDAPPSPLRSATAYGFFSR